METSTKKKPIPIPSRRATVRLALIDRDPGQPRQTFKEETIRDLAQSILQHGMVHDIYLRKHPEIDGRYMLVAGERRFRALQCLEVEEWDDFKIIEDGVSHYTVSMIENMHREDLNPMDEAHSYAEWMERDDLTVTQVADLTGKHFTEIYASLRLLKLAPEVQELIRSGKLSIKSSIQQLAQFKPHSDQIRLAKLLICGINPPEFDEALSKTHATSVQQIIARLPKEPAGIIRRLLDFRSRSFSSGFAIQAF